MDAGIAARCADGACGSGAPGEAFIGEPKFVSAVNGGGYRRFAMFNTANESGTGAYDCEPLSRRSGPDGERFAVYAQFAINDGWTVP